MKYYLGVDGGGSKTLCMICDQDGRIVGSGKSGCGNHQLDAALAEKNIRLAVNQALDSANLESEDITFAVFGLAGADREVDFRILRPMIARLWAGRHTIVCDTVIGLAAGTRQADGVVLICGSGTNCYGINRHGEGYQCGGFGYTFGDFGGGGELAQEAFRSVIRSWDGRAEQTLLTSALLDSLGYLSVDDMFSDYLDNEKRVPIHLARLLFEVAENDAVARGILRHQGVELGLAAKATIEKLNMQDDVFDVVLAGSILARGDSRFIIPHIKEMVHKVAPGCRLRILSVEPVAGALVLAMHTDEHQIDAQVYDTLEKALSIKEHMTV